MHQTQRADRVGICQLVVKLGDLWRQQQAFVDDSARRQRRNVEEVFVRQIGRGDFRFGALAHDIEFALQLILRSCRTRRG